MPTTAKLCAATTGLLLLAGCGSSDPATGTGPLQIEAAFYPLQWMAQQIGGDLVSVDSLTKPGAEPHDLELTPSDVAKIGDADLVVYLSGFQAAVDEAVDAEAADSSYDAKDAADLSLTYTPIEGGIENTGEAGETDPHFWLDPTKLADVGDDFAARLGEVDPDNADTYTANAETLRGALEALDQEFSDGLASCANKDLITSHNAFGYLAQRYDLTQVGITGLTPEEEPSPADLASVTSFVEENDVKTIYYETLISPAIAETVARETGAQTEVLDPIEGLNDDSQGSDYLEVMRSNLANIKTGQPCP